MSATKLAKLTKPAKLASTSGPVKRPQSLTDKTKQQRHGQAAKLAKTKLVNRVEPAKPTKHQPAQPAKQAKPANHAPTNHAPANHAKSGKSGKPAESGRDSLAGSVGSAGSAGSAGSNNEPTKTFMVQSSKMVCADPASFDPQIVACLNGTWLAKIATMTIGRLGDTIASLEVCHADYADKTRKYASIQPTNQPDSGQYCFFDQPAYQQTVRHARKVPNQASDWLGQCAYITQKAPYWSTLSPNGVVCASTGQSGQSGQSGQNGPTGHGFPILVDKRGKLAVAFKVAFLQKPS
jgi:hypothetical protein